MIEFSNRIPLGMHRSVKWRNTLQKQHPVRDASLTGCTERSVQTFSTERYIPIGMSKTVICFLFFIPYLKNFPEKFTKYNFSVVRVIAV